MVPKNIQIGDMIYVHDARYPFQAHLVINLKQITPTTLVIFYFDLLEHTKWTENCELYGGQAWLPMGGSLWPGSPWSRISV